MAEFITNYWLEFVFGVIAAAMTAFCKHYYSLYQQEKQHKKAEFLDEIKKNISESDSTTREQIKDVEKNLTVKMEAYYDKSVKDDEEIRRQLKNLSDGVLSTQGEAFKKKCKDLLALHRTISIDEWAEISSEHEIYHNLNGNHDGDILYQAVETAYLAGVARK